MFGKKKEIKNNPSMVMFPGFQNNEQEDNQYPQVPQNIQQPVNQPVNQPQYKQQVQQFPQQIQQVQQQQFQPAAKILKGEINADGTYYYIIETNYPLALGDCNLSQ
jgi:hypothetical protein